MLFFDIFAYFFCEKLYIIKTDTLKNKRVVKTTYFERNLLICVVYYY